MWCPCDVLDRRYGCLRDRRGVDDAAVGRARRHSEVTQVAVEHSCLGSAASGDGALGGAKLGGDGADRAAAVGEECDHGSLFC